MKIGFYFAFIDASYGGIYQYAQLILNLILKQDYISKIYIFFSAGQDKLFEAYRSDPRVELILYHPRGPFYRLYKKVAEFYLNRYYLHGLTKKRYLNIYKWLHPSRKFFNRYDIDILHIPWQLAPCYHTKAKVITTMHDLQHLHFPEFFTPIERLRKDISYYQSINESDHIIVGYEHVKQDVLRYFEVPDDKVSVCLDPAHENWYAKDDADIFDELKQKYPLKEKFMLTPASTWQHKNHMSVLKALKQLKDAGKEIFWVCTGMKQEYYFSVLEPTIKELGLENDVLFTDLVSDEELISFYHHAHLVIVPTLYEAGSGPLFEAWRYNCVVVASNVTTLPEHMDAPSYLFDPLNIDQIKALILKGWDDDIFREENLKHGRDRIAYFTGLNYSDSFTRVYRNLSARA